MVVTLLVVVVNVLKLVEVVVVTAIPDTTHV